MGSNPIRRSNFKLACRRQAQKDSLMKISDFLSLKAVSADIVGETKEEVIQELLGLLTSSGDINKRHKNKIFEILIG